MVHLVTKLAHKYGLTYAVLPWADKWLSSRQELQSSGEEEIDDTDVEDGDCPGWSAARLCIGWILGDESLIAHQLSQLVRSARLNEKGEFHIVDCVGAGSDENSQESASASEVGLILDALEVRGKSTLSALLILVTEELEDWMLT